MWKKSLYIIKKSMKSSEGMKGVNKSSRMPPITNKGNLRSFLLKCCIIFFLSCSRNYKSKNGSFCVIMLFSCPRLSLKQKEGKKFPPPLPPPTKKKKRARERRGQILISFLKSHMHQVILFIDT